MLFNSQEFLFLFLPVALAGFYFFRRLDLKNATMLWMFMASLFFYGWWNPVYLPLLLVSLFFNFRAGRKLRGMGIQKSPYLRLALGAAIALDLCLLGYFKYTGFLTQNLNAALGTDFNADSPLLPLGISFFTFQQIAFLVDSAKGRTPAAATFSNYGTFVTFFPHLIAGPLVHHRDMMPQFLRRDQKSFWLKMAVGLSIVFIGLFKKVILADTLDLYATPVFSAASLQTTLDAVTALTGLLAYTFQIYFDFSGYSDMAIGLAFLFGIRLPANFLSPYKAESIISFWRRWHMTLSRFLKDYLYIPLGGNRHGSVRRLLNLMITMLLGGLWHGAGWTFVIWGGLHGSYLVINHLWKSLGVTLPRPLATLFTFLAVMLAWAFFRADSVESALHLLSALLQAPEQTLYNCFWGTSSPLRSLVGMQLANIAAPFLLICFTIIWALPNTLELTRRYHPCLKEDLISSSRKKLTWRATPLWALFIGMVAAIALLKVVYEPSETFLYFQF